jgi:hypothetical protein
MKVIFGLIVLINIVESRGLNTVKATNGYPWPMPQSMKTSDERLIISPSSFRFILNSTGCDLIVNAFERYYQMIFFPKTYLNYILNKSFEKQNSFEINVNELNDAKILKHLQIKIEDPCDEWPSLESNESCN